jgi:hypothetical protein
MPRRSLALLPLLGLLAGCATFVNGSTSPLSVTSPEPNATLTILDETNHVVFSGTMPATIDLQTGKGFFGRKSYTVKVISEGGAEQVFPVKTSVSWWYLLGNMVSFGPIGWLIIDPATGAMWTLDRTEIAAQGRTAQLDPGAGKVKLAQMPDVPPALRPSLVRVR